MKPVTVGCLDKEVTVTEGSSTTPKFQVRVNGYSLKMPRLARQCSWVQELQIRTNAQLTAICCE